MTNKQNEPKTLEQLETEIISLKIRISRLESYIKDMPNPSDYFEMHIPGLGEEEMEDVIEKAIDVVSQYDRASASLLQRKLSIGYARAARLLDILENRKVVGPADGSKPREVLKKK